MKTGLRNIWQASKGIVITAILTILIVAGLRIFLFASFSVSTPSMQPTVIPGDHILVNKLVPGPRMDWLFGSSGAGDNRSYRLKGYKPAARGDVLVFNAPYYDSNRIAKNLGVHYVKRCIGIPGDTLYINDSAYELKTAKGTVKMPLLGYDPVADSWMETYTPEMFKSLDWTLTDFGPAYIPRAGDDIALDSVNIPLYRSLIEYETDGAVVCAYSECYLDDKLYTHHLFKQGYFFVAGDLAMNSEDSRFWGLLPADHIVGKAVYIWRSVDPNTKKHRLDRFLKALD